ncbi:ABC transporter substrate-binding protein [Rossellomorea sp. BNER]|uniref:ABC transporter substrate-binding protein n=1 Tax=Rossellomorea sp. BNER TaxID=2962031 RepID=UPI003AF30B02|nr:ABC transporter substrate-binding protein [Rossellomorea sp. BNER]
MVILEHYVQLYLHRSVLNETFPLSIEEISISLLCTQRNSKLKVRKWEELGWIKWIPGRGRGNKSQITFLQDPFDLILEKSKELVKKGDLNRANKVIHEYDPYFPTIETEFQLWMDQLFGFQVETQNHKSIDKLRIKIGPQPIYLLDPTLITLRTHYHIVEQICDTLVDFDKESGSVVPGLSFYWECTPDAKVWTFYLRKGVRFHNGATFSAKDVAFTFHRFKEKNNSYQWLLNSLSEMNVINDHCIKFTLSEPNHMFHEIVSSVHLSILCSKQKDFNEQNLIGTGPFKLKRNDESMLVLEANDSYFQGRPYLDVIEMWNLESESGELDQSELVFGLYPKDMMRKKASGRSRNYQLEMNVQFLSLNGNKKGPLEDIHFRKALKAILSPVELINEVGGHRQQVAEGFISKNSFKPTNREEILGLLSKSTYKGKPLQLFTFRERDHREDVEWIQAQCEKYGIRIESNYLDAETLLKAETLQQADIIHDSASIDEQTEMCFLQLLLAENSPVHQHIQAPLFQKVNTMIETTYCLSSSLDRVNELKKIEKILLEEIQFLPLYRNQTEMDVHENLKEVRINAQGWIDFRHVWFKKGEDN